MFRDRLDAARQLAGKLAHLRDRNPLVLAIPRGGVPMGRLIADELDGELDVVLVRKIGAPWHAEFAIGAVSEDGTVTLEPQADHYGKDAIDREVARQRDAIKARRQRYTPIRAPIDPEGRVVVVVDDGSATGATMAAALSTLRQRRPERLIAAIGVAPPDTLSRLESLADEVVCLEAPRGFSAVGQFFADFGQVEDSEVEALLGDRR